MARFADPDREGPGSARQGGPHQRRSGGTKAKRRGWPSGPGGAGRGAGPAKTSSRIMLSQVYLLGPPPGEPWARARRVDPDVALGGPGVAALLLVLWLGPPGRVGRPGDATTALARASAPRSAFAPPGQTRTAVPAAAQRQAGGPAEPLLFALLRSGRAGSDGAGLELGPPRRGRTLSVACPAEPAEPVSNSRPRE